MPERFLTLEELYDRKHGQDAVLRPVAHRPDPEHEARTAIGWAEARLLSYTPAYRGRLPETPATTPDAIKDTVADLARYRLELSNEQAAPTVIEAGNRAMKFLADVAAGRSQLNLPKVRVDDKRPTVTVSPRADAIHFDHAGAGSGTSGLDL